MSLKTILALSALTLAAACGTGTTERAITGGAIGAAGGAAAGALLDEPLAGAAIGGAAGAAAGGLTDADDVYLGDSPL